MTVAVTKRMTVSTKVNVQTLFYNRLQCLAILSTRHSQF